MVERKTDCVSGDQAKEIFMVEQSGTVKKAEEKFKMMMKK